MADQVAILRSAKVVSCSLCRSSFPGSEFDSHDQSEGHTLRKKSFLIDLAVRRVDGFSGCPGPVAMLRGNPRLDH